MFESKRLKFQHIPRIFYLLLIWIVFIVQIQVQVEAKASIVEGGGGGAQTVTNASNADTFQGSSAQLLSSWQHKLDTIVDVLGRVDDSVQNLQEKAHTWAIFHHHIDSWNEQMKALEHKIDLIKRTQDEHQTMGNKLTSLEFTLNHVLSKVVFLSDSCYTKQQQALNGVTTPSMGDGGGRTSTESSIVVEILRELQRSAAADKKMRSELMARLSNVLHRVQRIEGDRMHEDRGQQQKMARLMHPVGGCNATQRHQHNLDQTLRAMDQKLATALAAPALPLKDLKQLLPLAKKNARSLETLAASVAETEETLTRWRDAEANHTRSLHEYCAAVSGELSTFTESSDLLLKRIELVVSDVNEKLERIKCEERARVGGEEEEEEKDGEKDHDKDEADENEEKDEEQDEDKEKDVVNHDSSEHATESAESFDVEESEQAEEEEDQENHTEEIDFVHPSKIGCHELTDHRVDGIYRFSGPELNEAGRDFNERLCSFATDGPAWTVIQNRGPYREQENFNRSWAEYRNGFGRLDKDFWFGTEHIHQLVYRDDYELRIELEDFEGVRVWVEYAVFRVDSEGYNYNLLIGGYRGAVPDAMQYHNELDFSTYDRRNDRSVDACCACATGYASGWWYDNCSEANLNGVYRDTPLGHNYVGIIWEHWRGDYSLRRARMMIRPKEPERHEPFNEFAEDP